MVRRRSLLAARSSEQGSYPLARRRRLPDLFVSPGVAHADAATIQSGWIRGRRQEIFDRLRSPSDPSGWRPPRSEGVWRRLCFP